MAGAGGNKDESKYRKKADVDLWLYDFVMLLVVSQLFLQLLCS